MVLYYLFVQLPNFETKYLGFVHLFLKQKTKKRLSKAALETLSIVAYKQPMTKVEVEQIRGVNSDYSIQKLLEKELVTIVGRSEKPGRPLLFATSPKFMDYFGIKSLKHLPKVKDFKDEANEIGEPQAIEEADPKKLKDAAVDEENWTLKQVTGTWTFWLILLALISFDML